MRIISVLRIYPKSLIKLWKIQLIPHTKAERFIAKRDPSIQEGNPENIDKDFFSKKLSVTFSQDRAENSSSESRAENSSEARSENSSSSSSSSNTKHEKTSGSKAENSSKRSF